MKKVILLGIAAAITALAQPKTELLWPNGAPGAAGNEESDKPSITIWPADPAKATGTAVVVCPGGGYGNLAMDHEGKQIAEYLNNLGISAFVLKYRLGPRYHHPAPLQDAQRAIRTVRSRAAELEVSPDRIGIWGFSAGGHLASTAGTHFDNGKADAQDPIERVSSRPDFMILAYPVISLTTEYVHKGSRRNLLGDNPDPKLVPSLSNQLQVSAQTPSNVPVPPQPQYRGAFRKTRPGFPSACARAEIPAQNAIFSKRANRG